MTMLWWCGEVNWSCLLMIVLKPDLIELIFVLASKALGACGRPLELSIIDGEVARSSCLTPCWTDMLLSYLKWNVVFICSILFPSRSPSFGLSVFMPLAIFGWLDWSIKLTFGSILLAIMIRDRWLGFCAKRSQLPWSSFDVMMSAFEPSKLI